MGGVGQLVQAAVGDLDVNGPYQGEASGAAGLAQEADRLQQGLPVAVGVDVSASALGGGAHGEQDGGVLALGGEQRGGGERG